MFLHVSPLRPSETPLLPPSPGNPPTCHPGTHGCVVLAAVCTVLGCCNGGRAGGTSRTGTMRLAALCSPAPSSGRQAARCWLHPAPPTPAYFLSLTGFCGWIPPSCSPLLSSLSSWACLRWKKSFFEGRPSGAPSEALLPPGERRPGSTGPRPHARPTPHGDGVSWLHLFHSPALLRRAK